MNDYDEKNDKYHNDSPSEQWSLFSDSDDELTYYPSMYGVFLKKDPFTPKEFIIFIMRRVFRKSDKHATKAAEELSKKGIIHCGHYTKDVAETKIIDVNKFAHEDGYNMKCVIQKGKHNVIEES